MSPALSARNHITGRIQQIKAGTVMAEVVLDCGGQPLVAVITQDSVHRLALKEGDSVHAVIKATDVMISR